MASSNELVPESIYAFLAGMGRVYGPTPGNDRLDAWQRQNRNQPSSSDSTAASSVVDLTSIHLRHVPSVAASAWGSSTGSASTSSTSTSSRQSSGFSRPPSRSSYHTTPSSPPGSIASTAHSVNFAHATTEHPHNLQLRLPCEFARLGICDQTFRSDEAELWEEHIKLVHLQDKLPRRCICWFCDKGFSSQDLGIDESYNFWLRLDHIREHIIHRGLTAQQMRPDYFLLEHLFHNGLVPEVLYHQERERSEGPTASGIVDHDFTPPGRQRARELDSRVIHDNDKEERQRRRGQLQAGRRPRVARYGAGPVSARQGVTA